MMQQARDLLEEGKELKSLLDTLSSDQLNNSTNFKNWTVNKVVQHLHGSDRMAVLSLKDPEGFKQTIKQPDRVRSNMNPEQAGTGLVQDWWQYFEEMAELLGASDPKRRLPWFGPDMGVMMFTTARQMETWAHGQDIYDLLRRPRTPTDRIKNIAVLGVKTYGWTFANRGEPVPEPVPQLILIGPSGAEWVYGEDNAAERIVGLAEEFCQVVTQTRNIVDTALSVTGSNAMAWMVRAQCFAGSPQDPPTPGTRRTV